MPDCVDPLSRASLCVRRGANRAGEGTPQQSHGRACRALAMDHAAMEALNMAKTPTYDAALILEETPPEEPAPARQRTGKGGTNGGGRTLKDAAAQTVIYLHPAASKALKRYALDKDVK